MRSLSRVHVDNFQICRRKTLWGRKLCVICGRVARLPAPVLYHRLICLFSRNYPVAYTIASVGIRFGALPESRVLSMHILRLFFCKVFATCRVWSTCWCTVCMLLIKCMMCWMYYVCLVWCVEWQPARRVPWVVVTITADGGVRVGVAGIEPASSRRESWCSFH